ncbi:MAG: Glucokinase [Lentisphaerae bacterium ADurb.Bin242]|nr:MAG: Glucokinase [Lentisphaerae bacterium ADurb.Bin242]
MKPENIIKLNDVKNANILSLLEILLRHDTISRVEIARKLHCDNTTVTRAVRDLMSRGLIVSTGKHELAHGRPREMLSLNPDGHSLLGISLDPNLIAGVLTDFRGNVRSREKTFFREKCSRADFLEALEKTIRHLSDYAGPGLAGIGLSTFGSYASADFHLKNVASFPELNGLRLKNFFIQKGQPDIEISDILISRLFYELRKHPESARGTLLLVSSGDSGIGMATASGGQILFSRQNHGGELGHNICEPDGLPCACGRRGCLETRASKKMVLEKVRALKNDRTLSFEALTALYQSGDKETVREVNTAARYLGTAIANQVNNLLPDSLVLTGSMMNLGKAFHEELKRVIFKLAFPLASEALSVRFSEPDDETGAIGAAMLVARKLLNDFAEFDRACPRRNQ